ncbi:aminotransferase class I and II [Actinomadura craniellae]|uniref:Aminotransferase class I and II n=1 Tax=Actinomadura craniellae TaxID=2231787 RepID=A0A365H0K1_9ACTN|nr:HipA family kinase [Actinomadura craniellae]RAY12566.1 aminotransferase class I and II [Actinomadura craniellae]
MLPLVTATRYVTPLREGGSLPGVVEADDLGTYVVKFVGAGQGRKALVAEVIAGELGRRLGFRVPDQAIVDLDPVIARHEPDSDVQDLLKASTGWNLGVDFLPGSLGYDPLGWTAEPGFASRLLWFDAFIDNVDRSWRNPNMLVWHGDVWLIDHGASLIFHHAWANAGTLVTRSYDAGDHVLAGAATELAEADALLAPQITEELLRAATALVPDPWLADEPGFADADAVRDAYVEHLLTRVAEPRGWLPVPGSARPRTARSGRYPDRPEWLAG